MAGTVFIVILCLSVRVASDHGRTIDGTGPEEGVMVSVEEPMTADAGEEQERSMNDALLSAHLAGPGLADLVHTMTLLSHSLNLSPTQGEDTGASGGDKQQGVTKGLADLVHRMTLFSHALNSSNSQPEDDGDGDGEQNVTNGLADLVHRMSLFSHALNSSNSQHEGDGDGNSDKQQSVTKGLADLVYTMKLLSEALMSTTAVPPTPPVSSTSIPGSGEQSCLPPFQQIAYRMCILEEMQLKLSWNDAQKFCRERGAELAVDMTIIKARRFLNDLYGEYGTRSRWPVWVGGRRSEQMKWKWAQRDLEVPSFLWAPSEPREYTGNVMPEGVCMILDGYRRYHGASLPCHLRRRFICQLLQ